MEIKASEAAKLTDEVVGIFSGYADCAQKWDIEEEQDFQNLKDAVLDCIADFGKN